MREVRLENLTKSFAGTRLFDRLSLTIEPMKYVCLLGPSGCGKTTLIRLIAGLDRPDSGSVLIGDELMNDRPPHARDIGLAFQNYALYPHFTVQENLAFPLRAPVRRKAYPEARVSALVRAMADRMKLTASLGQPVNRLSGGQQQRVALGRALIHRPRVLLLDEPMTHLDARLRYEMRGELKQLHHEMKTTTVHVTHDQQEALALSHIMVVMRDGRIEQVGAPLSLYEDPDTVFVAKSVGDPPMSIVEGVLVERLGERWLELGGVTHSLPRDLAPAAARAQCPEVSLGIRPRSVTIAGENGQGAIPATVYSHEMVGRNMQITFQIGGGLVQYRTREPYHVQVGEAVRLHVALEGARLFDRKSGLAMRAI